MDLKCAVVVLHNPLFLGGKNFGNRLEPYNKHQGLALTYNREHGELWIKWGDSEAMVPKESIFSLEFGKAPKSSGPVSAPPQPVQAQVESPQSHVFEGPGKGKK